MQQQTAAILMDAAREAAQAALPRSRVPSRSNLGGGSSAASSYSSMQEAYASARGTRIEGASPASQISQVWLDQSLLDFER